MKRLLLGLTAILFAVSINANAGFEDVIEKEQTEKVHFNNNNYKLDSEAKGKLDALDTSGDEVKLIVIGKTDTRSDEDYNMRLGLARANAVADYLNVEDASISSVGKNEAIETNIHLMRNDRVAWVKVITTIVILRPIFGDANLNIKGPVHHIEHNTIPLGQGTNRNTPRM